MALVWLQGCIVCPINFNFKGFHSKGKGSSQINWTNNKCAQVNLVQRGSVPKCVVRGWRTKKKILELLLCVSQLNAKHTWWLKFGFLIDFQYLVLFLLRAKMTLQQKTVILALFVGATLAGDINRQAIVFYPETPDLFYCPLEKPISLVS